MSGKEDLGTLSLGRSQVYVSLLPSQAESVMIKYWPDVQVSCVIPPQNFQASYSSRGSSRKRTIDIITPTLIMSCGYGEVPTTQNHRQVNRGYTLWVIDTQRSDKIYTKPYIFANVYTTGGVCFGGLKPSSLRQAYNQYWSSSFNNDLYREPHNCGVKNHIMNYHNGCRCDPSHKKHTCECSKATFHRHRGCGCTTVPASKKCRGTCTSEFANTCACCQAINAVYEAARLADPSISQRKLNKLAVTEDSPYPGCGCTYRHKRGCRCGKNSCGIPGGLNCTCYCPCCQKTCVHDPCECSCCLDTCRCRCNCSTDMQFEQHITSYHDVFMPKQPWVDRTNLFCGTKFWASPVSKDGVLITNEKLLLNQIPRKYWRKDNHGNAAVIAMAEYKDGIWKLESGGFTFSLKESNVITK